MFSGDAAAANSSHALRSTSSSRLMSRWISPVLPTGVNTGHISCHLTYSGWLHTHTHTHSFNGPRSGTTRVSRYHKGKTNLDFTEARDSEWQWHQLSHMQVSILHSRSRQTTTPAPHHSSFFTGQMPFLPPNQQRQSTEGKNYSGWLQSRRKKIPRVFQAFPKP